MSPTAKNVTAAMLLVLLAAPTGLCSLAFTPMALGWFWEKGMARAYDELALICAGLGWGICGLTIWGAIRLWRPRLLDPSLTVVLGIVLLLPGICALVLVGSDPKGMLTDWLSLPFVVMSMAVSAGGAALIWSAVRRPNPP